MPNSLKKVGRTGSAEDITLLLSKVGNPEALRVVMGLVYGELYPIAVGHFRKELPGHTLTPTALLNEACVRLLESDIRPKNRAHFFGLASRLMREILVDSARRRNAQKRAGDMVRVDFSEAERIGFERPSDLLHFDIALSRLEATDPSLSKIAELRVFGGLSTTEIATILGCGNATARRKWAEARKWLARELR